MAVSDDFNLQADELAFHFESEVGIEASELGQFLQRAATVAKQTGTELRVTSLCPGSLAVIMRAVRRTRVGQAAEAEFYKAPIQTTVTAVGGAAGVVGTVAAAIAFAMSPEEAGLTPLAKAGANVVERQKVERIEVITINSTVLVMDRERAREVRAMERRARSPARLAGPEVRAIADNARRGTLTGSVHDVAGELHFRPDGYRYLVPIDLYRSDAAENLFPEANFRVSAQLHTIRGQPNSIVISSATRI